MKKTISALLIIALLLVLGGCTTLEQVRANQAFWTSETGGSIILDGVEYRSIASAYGDFQPLTDDTRYVYATQKDVPALLKEVMGAIVDISADGVFIYGTPKNVSESSIYCRADRYDEMKKRIEAGFTPEGYCYEYYNEEFDTQLYQLTDTEAAFLDQLLMTEVVAEVKSEELDNYASVGDIQSCSKDMLFRKAYISIWEQNGTHYISTQEYRNYGTVYFLLRQVPAEHMTALKDLMRFEPKNYNGWVGTAHTN